MLTKQNLHPYQLSMIKLGTSVPNLGLFMEPGLGKTVTALTIIAESPTGKTLIVAPKKVAESVWSQECQKWQHLQHLKVVKVMGTPQQRLSALKSQSDVYVVNVENLPWVLDQMGSYPFFDYLIIDESSRFKDPSTKRFKAIKKYLAKFDKRIILTGTPTPQGLADLWSQVGILDLGKRLETSITKFRAKYMFAADRNRHTGVVYKWDLNPGAAQIILDKISDICISLKAEDYLQLPKLSKIYHKIEIDKDVRQQYARMKKSMVLDIGEEQITAPTAATLVNKLLQLTSGAVYGEDGWSHVHDAKIDYLEELLESSSAPTLLFYHFKHSRERILERFPHAVELSEGKIQDWRDGKIKLLIAHPQSGGIGLNLQCNVGDLAQLVWFDLPWSSENFVQANARIYRQGQEKPVVIHHLTVPDTIDERVVDVLEGKIKIQDALLDELKLT